MAWSKSTRIKVMMVIDTAFFFVELTCGFLAHSLALTADAFHMLNDIISLIIGLWAVVAAQKATTDEFTFGWVRAEILGAFFNAVFLIALCVTIVLEALTRFVEPPEINNPKLILAVGCAGLFSNLLGFFVLGGHGHSHGPEDQDHDDDGHEHAHGHAHGHKHDEEEAIGGTESTIDAADESGAVADVLPEVVVGRATAGVQRSSSESNENPRRIKFGDDQSGSRASTRSRGHRSSRSGLASFEDISIYPASFRQDIIAVSKAASSSGHYMPSENESEPGTPCLDNWLESNEDAPLLQHAAPTHGTMQDQPQPSAPRSRTGLPKRESAVHDGHHHTMPQRKQSATGHSHGDMGMKAMVLHVIGDALGNLGVIVTALIIWLTDWPGKLYADPAVSLVITAIILRTSIPLTRATSRVLLQATPENISVQEIRHDIEALPGVVSCHHIHVWQLSDTKVVASMHLQVAFPIDSDSGEKYMQLARRARQCLHGFGIHSATIQPEFCFDHKHQHDADANGLRLDGSTVFGNSQPDACLLECADDCEEQGCCKGSDAMSKGIPLSQSSGSSHGDGSSHEH